MAINQQPFQRSIDLPTVNISTGQGFTQLANATSAVSNLLTEKINEVAISQAGIQGEADVQNERQPEKLALPFTKATRAYNQAVSNTEARRMAASADELIQESLINNKNPATFNRGTPAKFAAELAGIKSGILEHTRDENREAIREHLDRQLAKASLNMLEHSVSFDNQQTKADMQQDISRLLEARRNAVIEGDKEVIKGIDDALEQSLNDYSTMNAEIARIAPYLKNDIAKTKSVDNVLGGYADALHNKTTTQFLSDLADNKSKLPFNIWQDAVKAVVALDQNEKRLKNDINAESLAQVRFGIQSGGIQNPDDLLVYNLTVPQQLAAMHELDVHQAQEMTNGSQLIIAQQNILNGRPQFNSASTANKMFQNKMQESQQSTGKIATLTDMSKSILGQGDFSASGMPGTPMGTNVPIFDSLMQGKLTSRDPIATAQAGMVYKDMVYTQEQPESVRLTGDALAVATLFNELNQADTTPEQAAQLAINTVLNAKEPEIAQRIERFHKTLEKTNQQTGQQDVMRSKFKDAFGLAPQAFGSDEAFRVFKDIFRANYIASNSESAAMAATKQSMRSWGTSKYFDNGFVGQPVPEKELPLTKVGNAFDNQIVSTMQGFINRTNVARDAYPDLNVPLIEWVDPKQTVTGSESEQDKVFKKMTIGNHPRIKINGHETDVVLIPSASSRLDNNINYIFGVYDQFNNLHPLKDITNGVDQVARFSPQELSLWAPQIATQQTDDAIRGLALKVREKEIQAGNKELKELEKKTPAWQLIFGVAKPDEYLQYIANRNNNTDEGRLAKIIDSLKSAKSPSATRKDITDADNVGIASILEPNQ